MPLIDELRTALNRYSAENGSNTPDFILAEYLHSCLDAFDRAVQKRAAWYGRLDRPGQSDAALPPSGVAATPSPFPCARPPHITSYDHPLSQPIQRITVTVESIDAAGVTRCNSMELVKDSADATLCFEWNRPLHPRYEAGRATPAGFWESGASVTVSKRTAPRPV